ncbi:MAG: GumC family protein [Methylovirgula sp.]
MRVASQSPRPSLRGQFIDADFDLPALGAALWRHRLKILRPTIIVALLTLAVVVLIPPKYLSESRVLIVGRDNVFLRPDADKDIIDRGIVDPEAVTSQAQLILSRDLASEVIAKLKLGDRPEFDPALGGISLVKALLGFFGFIKNPMSMTPQERMLEAYYDRLSVYAVDKSRVIVIDFLSENPELAARVANAVADAYLEGQQAAKQEQARNAGQWLAGEIDSMRNKVADAEAKVEAFRAKSNLLVGPNNTTLSAQQLGDINAQLAAARTQKADAQAKANLIRSMLQSGEPIESSDILNSELIRRLSEQRVTLRAQLAEQSSSLLDNHPRIKELKAQIADLDKQIRKEAEIMARSLENDAKLADARVEAQLATFDLLKGQAVTTNEQDIQLRALERDAKSQRDLLESYLAKYREASARDTINSAPPDARVISRATVSNVPAYPKKLPTVLIASLATLVLMSGMVLTGELLASPASAATRVPGRAAGKAFAERTAAPVRAAAAPAAPAAPAAAGATTAAPLGRRWAGRVRRRECRAEPRVKPWLKGRRHRYAPPRRPPPPPRPGRLPPHRPDDAGPGAARSPTESPP